MPVPCDRFVVFSDHHDIAELLLKVALNTINQTYFSYIVAFSFIGGGNRSARRKPPICQQTLSSTPLLSGIRTHNVSGDRH
jgi:hypothetical protein